MLTVRDYCLSYLRLYLSYESEKPFECLKLFPACDDTEPITLNRVLYKIKWIIVNIHVNVYMHKHSL